MADVASSLKQRWDDLASTISATVSAKWWSRLEQHYSEPHRAYHTLAHLHHMFSLFDQHKDALSNRVAVAFAIYFHDIVYDVRAADNETRSVAVLQEFVEEAKLEQCTTISDLIASTESHCTAAHSTPGAYGSDDVHYFIDMDMAILGSAWEEYDGYRQAVRREYSHMADAAYASERGKVLRLFLQIPNIFATKTFRDSFEAQARSNMEKEIKLLSE